MTPFYSIAICRTAEMCLGNGHQQHPSEHAVSSSPPGGASFPPDFITEREFYLACHTASHPDPRSPSLDLIVMYYLPPFPSSIRFNFFFPCVSGVFQEGIGVRQGVYGASVQQTFHKIAGQVADQIGVCGDKEAFSRFERGYYRGQSLHGQSSRGDGAVLEGGGTRYVRTTS